jgi:Domain of unknown function (DUF4917)
LNHARLEVAEGFLDKIIIRCWSQLKAKGWKSLLVGNGGSMAIHSGFGYASLRDVAKGECLLQNADAVFDSYKTSNFEHVLEALDHARRVNVALGTQQVNVENAYVEVRSALIKAVRHIHCDRKIVAPHLPTLVTFLKPFATVVTFNYDLILYLAMLEGNLLDCWFKDGFVNQEFVPWWQKLRAPKAPATGSTLVFFAHGSLILGRNDQGIELKLIVENPSIGYDISLLDTITKAWSSATHTPLFISEGTSSEKLRAIQPSRYLSVVHGEVLGDLGESVVTYGFGFADNDLQVLKAIAARRKSPKRLAVSVFMEVTDEAQQAFCHDVYKQVRNTLGNKVEVYFFRHDSPGCWIN